MLSQIYDYVTKYASTLVVSKAIAISGLAFQSLKMHWAESFERKIAPNTSKKSNLFNPLWLRRFVDRSTYHFKVGMKRRSLEVWSF